MTVWCNKYTQLCFVKYGWFCHITYCPLSIFVQNIIVYILYDCVIGQLVWWICVLWLAYLKKTQNKKGQLILYLTLSFRNEIAGFQLKCFIFTTAVWIAYFVPIGWCVSHCWVMFTFELYVDHMASVVVTWTRRSLCKVTYLYVAGTIYTAMSPSN